MDNFKWIIQMESRLDQHGLHGTIINLVKLMWIHYQIQSNAIVSNLSD